MDLGLHGKVAVITGGSKGIGFAVAKEFLTEGAKVAICARNSSELEDAAKTLRPLGEVYYETIDATNQTEIFAFAEHIQEHFGSIDCWINNVGAPLARSGDVYTPEEIDTITKICFHSTVYGSEAAFGAMKKNGGSILNVSSLAARCATAGRSTLYAPLKAAVVTLATTLAGEYAAYGIRVNAVLPGFTVTPAVKATISPEELQINAEGTLLHRLATPEEIAKPIVFLCSEAATYITATSLEISGGRSVVLNPSYSYECKKQE